MGNKNGINDAIDQMGQNKIVNFKGGYFSFAFGNEIALVLDGYYILNCDSELWREVCQNINKESSIEDAKALWLKNLANMIVTGKLK